jgi:hypothetical protein
MSRSTNQGATISRSYTVVSSRGTTGTYHQQVLAFTIAGNKAPARIFQGFLAAWWTPPCVLAVALTSRTPT